MNKKINTGSDALDKIIQHKQSEVAQAKRLISWSELEQAVSLADPVRGFERALKDTVKQGDAAVIAEIKKASPSKGVIRQDFNPVDIAQSYQSHGATCISVLTDQPFFQGSDDYFKQAREKCSLPMIRKDFMLEPYQILQSRVLGADCVLLIAAALGFSLLKEMYLQAIELSMDVLIEVHNHQELEQVLELTPAMIGINNRNLRTFNTQLNTTIELLEFIPNNILVVTESGIHSADDVTLMRKHQVNAFLVGEAFMRAKKPGEEMQKMFGFK